MTKTTEPQDARAIAFVFAGREKFMRILIKYLRRELDAGVLDEVHLWDCCRTRSDQKYLHSLASRQIKVMSTGGYGWFKFRHKILLRKGWWWWQQAQIKFRKIYRYYFSAKAGLKNNDVLIRIDDDVVYLNNLRALRDYAREQQQPGLVFPSIINNDVAAVWQVHDGLLDPSPLPPLVRNLMSPDCFSDTSLTLSEWHLTPECAAVAHEQFLSDPSAFTSDKVHAWDVPQRVSVNVWALNGACAKIAFAEMNLDEEAYLTHTAAKKYSFRTTMLMEATAVHFSFGPQEKTGELESFLPRYASLAEKECPE